MTNRHELAMNDIQTMPSAPLGISTEGYNTSFYPSITQPLQHNGRSTPQELDYRYVQGRGTLPHPFSFSGDNIINSNGTVSRFKVELRGDEKDGDLATNYRINKIGEYVKYLDAEIKERERLKKSYGKFDKTLFGVECTCMVTELGLTGTSFVVAPLALITAPVCLGLTVVSAFLRNGSKMLSKKIKKHTAIELLAKSKRNSIDEKYTRAMEDGVISDTEFQDIRKEITNYDDMKKELLNGFKNGGTEALELTKEVRMTLINKGKEDGKKEIKEELKTKLKL